MTVLSAQSLSTTNVGDAADKDDDDDDDDDDGGEI